MAMGATAEAQSPRELRVGIVWPADAELRRGLSFGIEEARRSLALFRWSVVVDTVGPGDSLVNVAALVALDSAPRGDVPVILLSCAPRGGAFVIAACPADSTVEWHQGLSRFGAAQLNDRYRAATGTGMTAQAWKGWFGLKLLTESAMRARRPQAADIAARLRDSTTAFDGHKGVALWFDARGILKQPLYALVRDDDGNIVAREVKSP
jgi:hypothetical protein